MKIFAYALVLAFVLSAFQACAIGISPSKQAIVFERGGSGSFSFSALNKEGNPMPVKVYATGEMAEYITFERTEGVVESSQSFGFTINFPDTALKPGTHEARITVEENPPESEAGAGIGLRAKTGAAMILEVKSLFPGKYAEMEMMQVADINIGGVVFFEAKVTNYGMETISGIKGTVNIFDASGSLIKSFQTSEIARLDSKQNGDISAYWAVPGDAAPGDYRVELIVDYEGSEQEIKRSRSFHVGGVFVKILGVSTSNIKPNSIGKFNIAVKSEWNSPIDNAYADVFIYGVPDSAITGAAVSPVDAGMAKSSGLSIGPFGTGTLTAFWEIGELNNDNYRADIKLYYSGKVAQQALSFRPDSVESTNSNLLYTIIIGVLATALIVLGVCTIALFVGKRRK